MINKIDRTSDKEGVYEEGTNKKVHPAQHPIKLVTRCIGFVTKKGETILDPFIGSGTTAVACKKIGRNFIGFEIDKKYVDLAQKRVNKQWDVKNEQEIRTELEITDRIIKDSKNTSSAIWERRSVLIWVLE